MALDLTPADSGNVIMLGELVARLDEHRWSLDHPDAAAEVAN